MHHPGFIAVRSIHDDVHVVRKRRRAGNRNSEPAIRYERRLKSSLHDQGENPSRLRFISGTSKIRRVNSINFPMKKLSIFFILAWSSWTVLGQTQNATTAPAPTPYSIISRSANSRVWEQTTYENSPSGQAIPQQHYYTEVASGLCYQQNGQWMDSQEQINILPDGSAAATNGQHQAYFPPDIYNGVIKLVTPDGLTLQSLPVGLSYDCPNNQIMRLS